MKNKKQNKKFLAALALGILMVSGLAINVSAIDDSNLAIDSSNGIFKGIKNNPLDFINTAKIFVPANFDYVEQMNREFVKETSLSKKVVYIPGDSLRALEKE